MKKKKTADEESDDKLVAWAKRQTAGMDQSAVMVGVMADREDAASWRFKIQVGHCLVEGKPLVLLVPIGHEIPDKLRAAATAVEEYRVGDQNSINNAMTRLFNKLGLEKRH